MDPQGSSTDPQGSSMDSSSPVDSNSTDPNVYPPAVFFYFHVTCENIYNLWKLISFLIYFFIIIVTLLLFFFML